MTQQIFIDPNNKFGSFSKNDLIEKTGMILYWVIEAIQCDSLLKPYLSEAYMYGIHESTGGKVGNTGTYRYPEDPPLHPIMKAVTGRETLYMYEHAIVAIINNETGNQFITRMD